MDRVSCNTLPVVLASCQASSSSSSKNFERICKHVLRDHLGNQTDRRREGTARGRRRRHLPLTNIVSSASHSNNPPAGRGQARRPDSRARPEPARRCCGCSSMVCVYVFVCVRERARHFLLYRSRSRSRSGWLLESNNFQTTFARSCFSGS